MSGEELLVRKIQEGVVIDHIPAGRAFTVLKALGLLGSRGSGYRIAIVINAESRKMGRKDIVKIEGYSLGGRDVEVLGVVAPGATINVVSNFRVERKIEAVLPESAEGVLRCPNPTCITRQPREKAVPSMRLVSRRPAKYRCVYCGTTVDEGEFESLIEA